MASKICPVIRAFDGTALVTSVEYKGQKVKYHACVESQCAWFDEESKRCAVLLNARAAAHLAANT